MDPFTVMNVVGLVAFALVGASKAIRERLDLLGVVVAGVVTALGGGTTRDVLVDRVPISLQSPTEVAVSLVGVALAIGVARLVDEPERNPAILVADAVGLAAFATTGALVAADAGLTGFGVVGLAVVNAAGGGAMTDVLLDRTPFVLTDDFYATCTVLGGVAYVAVTSVGGTAGAGAAACSAVVLSVRLVALRNEWRLPVPADTDETDLPF